MWTDGRTDGHVPKLMNARNKSKNNMAHAILS